MSNKKKYLTKKKADKLLYRMKKDCDALFFDALDEIEALKVRVAELEKSRAVVITSEGVQDFTVRYTPCKTK